MFRVMVVDPPCDSVVFARFEQSVHTPAESTSVTLAESEISASFTHQLGH